MPEGWPRRFAVATITIGLSMSVLANSMTNLALPYIAHDLNISAESSIWIVNASQIALMISLLPIAALADIIGYRHVYRFGLALFSLASIGCALAPSLNWLILARTIQGLGGAAIMSVQPALVRAIYPRNMLGRGLPASIRRWSRPPSRPARRSARHCSRSGRGRCCSASTSRSASSRSCSPSATCRTPPTPIARSTCCRPRMSGATFGLLIFGIDGMAHGHSRGS